MNEIIRLLNSNNAAIATTCAALIALIASCFSPFLTAIANHAHERRMKTYETMYHSQTEAFSHLLAVGSKHYFAEYDDANAHELVAARATALLYASPQTQQCIVHYCSAIQAIKAGLPDNSIMDIGLIQTELILAMQADISNFKKQPVKAMPK